MADEAAEPEVGEDTPPADEVAEAADGDIDADVDEATEAAEEPEAPAAPKVRNHVRDALIAGLVAVVALGALCGWLGYRSYQARQAQQLQQQLVQVGRQGAINLTTIDFQHAEADVQRILDSATDQFYDDFAKRSQPFIDVVKQAQSKSVGTVTEAGLESVTGNEGQVLVAVTVQTSNRGATEQQPRSWRMRLTVKKSGDEAKVSKVEFVP
jgi:Mce-associated membrane protein